MVDDSSYLENVTLLGSPLLWFASNNDHHFCAKQGSQLNSVIIPTSANCAYITLKKLEQLYTEGQLKG